MAGKMACRRRFGDGSMCLPVRRGHQNIHGIERRLSDTWPVSSFDRLALPIAYLLHPRPTIEVESS